MLGRAVLLVACAALLQGCYSPSVTTGAPCDERMICPRNQVCIANRCELEGTVDIDAPIGDADLDARLPDALTLGPWSAPTPVGITPTEAKTDPSFTPDRLTVVFARLDDLFIATRPAIGGTWTVLPLTALNTMVSEKSPEITADGKTIYFASNPNTDYDIFISTFVNGAWTMPAKVPTWSGAVNEQDVAISPDELTAFVAVSGDLLRATRLSKADAWPVPASLGVTWGTSVTAPSINAAGDVYFHANNPRDVMVARKLPSGYAMPVPVTELNTAASRDAAPFISANDRHIMFERDAALFESSR
jgi:hypothetical protein